MKKKKRGLNNKGFSIVEIIIVIIIMGILTAALAPQVIGYVAKSREAADVQTGSSIATVVNIAIAETGTATYNNTIAKIFTEAGTATNLFQVNVKSQLGIANAPEPKTSKYDGFWVEVKDGLVEVYANPDGGTTKPVDANMLYPVVGVNFDGDTKTTVAPAETP